MDTQANESNEKRPVDAIEPEQNKRMGTEGAEAPKVPYEPVSTTNINDLDDDCFEQIFKRLNIKDLLALADSSKCFKTAVDYAYKRKYENIDVIISAHRESESEPIEFMSSVRSIYTRGSLFSLRFLRCFGHMITNLRVNYHYQNWTMVDRYINEYCAKSLNEIAVWNAQPGAMEYFTKPFPTIERVSLNHSDLNNSSIDLNTIFPKMNDLTIGSINKFDNHFPNLTSLKINEGTLSQTTDDVHQNVTGILKLNQQLRNLNLRDCHYLGAAVFQFISHRFRCLESLDISCSNFFDLQHRAVWFENLKNLQLHFSKGYKCSKIPFVFSKLESLSIFGNNVYIKSDLSNFISNHSTTLRKLCIRSSEHMQNPFKYNHLIKFPRLTDMDLGNCSLSLDETIDLLNKCKKLKRLRFKLDEDSTNNDLVQLISSKWRMLTEPDDFIILEC